MEWVNKQTNTLKRTRRQRYWAVYRMDFCAFTMRLQLHIDELCRKFLPMLKHKIKPCVESVNILQLCDWEWHQSRVLVGRNLVRVSVSVHIIKMWNDKMGSIEQIVMQWKNKDTQRNETRSILNMHIMFHCQQINDGDYNNTKVNAV